MKPPPRARADGSCRLNALADSLSLSRRTCVVTGLEDEPAAMLRFALSPDGVVTPDILRKLPGRGVWTRLDRATVALAAKKQAFARGFRKPVKADPALADQVDRLLEQDALNFLSLVNKAGLVVAGAMKVDAAIRAGRLVGAHSCERRLARRRGKARTARQRCFRRTRGPGSANKSLLIGPIGFGIGEGKCDTCSA